MACACDKKYIPNKDQSLEDLSTYYVKKWHINGNSMVSGALVLFIEKNPHIEPNDLKLYLKDCTNDLNFPQDQQGWGLIDIQKLFEGRETGARRKY